MSKLLLSNHGRLALQVCAAGAMAALMSGCSADATRVGEPFANPFDSASSDSAPAPRRHVAAASDVIPTGRMAPVTSQALAPRAVASAAPYRSATVASRELVSHETTGSIGPTPARMAANTSFGGWTSTGGTPIQVADGENATVLAQRYGVPVTALLMVNGLKSGGDVRPGARLTIPVYSATASASRTERMAEAPRAVAPVQAEERLPAPVAAHAARERLLSDRPVRTATGTPPHALALPTPRQVASHGVQTPATPKLARVEAPIAAPKAAKPVEAKATSAPAIQKVVAVKTAPSQPVATTKVVVPKVAAVAPPKAEVAKVAVAEAAPAPVPAAAPAAVASADNSPEFRWPARGRIIQSFKGGSGGNDGINIAVPEGTSVRAAEGGVVAYAGSELKGYGNLVLIRHPNGFVSAYANNGSIDVKRGETVKRGQEIAKSGQSGNVSSPQLHFELRKGSTPVDPTQFLAGL